MLLSMFVMYGFPPAFVAFSYVAKFGSPLRKVAKAKASVTWSRSPTGGRHDEKDT